MSIKSRRKTIEKKLDYWRDKLNALQEECNHENATREAKSNTGNYCPQDDHYWYEFDCPDCGKRWHEDQ